MSRMMEIEVPAMVDDSFLRKHTGHLRDFRLYAVELLTNGMDAGAKNLSVRWQEQRGCMNILFQDDGIGVTDQGLRMIPSLDMSEHADNPKKRGRNGNGLKGFVQHCDAIRIESKRAGDNRLFTIEFTLKELIQMWRTGTASWKTTTVPTNHSLRTCSGTLVTLLNVGQGEHVNKRHDRSPQVLIDSLGKLLSRQTCHLITIFDAQGKSHKITERRVLGTKIEGTGSIEGLGQVTYDLAVIPDPDLKQREHVEIWAMDEKICDLRAFLDRIRPTASVATLLDSVRTFLDHLMVIGMFMAPGFNSYIGGTDRTDFNQDLFDDDELIFRIIRFMVEKIVPEVEKNIGDDATEKMRNSDAHTFCTDLVRLMQAVGGPPKITTPTGDVDFDTLKVTPARIELEPGMQVRVEIKDPRPGVTYRWNASSSGGTIDRKVGTSVTLTGGNVQGRYQLQVSDGERTISILVDIVAELPFGFTVAARHCGPGERITHTLANTHHTSEKFAWTVQPADGKLEISPNTLSARHTLPLTLGQITQITVTVKEIVTNVTRSPKTARCTIFVAPRKDRDSQLRDPSTTDFSYNGRNFRLQTRVFASPEMQGTMSYIEPSIVETRPHLVTLNLGHVAFQGPDIEKRIVGQFQIALHIAQIQLRSDDRTRLLSSMSSERGSGVDPVMGMTTSLMIEAAQIFTAISKKRSVLK